MTGVVYKEALAFKKKYPGTIAWRIKAHAKVIEKHLNPEEEVKYVFVGQKGDSFWDFITTNIAVITNKRLLLGSKRLLWGYFFTSITPDLFNDLKIKANIIWGKAFIDTMGELVVFSKLSKKALDEIETEVTENIMREKKMYQMRDVQILS